MRSFLVALLLASIVYAQKSPEPDLFRRSPVWRIAIPVFRGSGTAQNVMQMLDLRLTSDMKRSGLVDVIPKGLLPLNIPQQPGDLHDSPNDAKFRSSRSPDHGLVLSDWSYPPVSAQYLVIGYSAVVRNDLVVYAWMFDLSHESVNQPQMLEKRYTGSLDEAGARSVADQFASDILRKILLQKSAHHGGVSL